MRFINFLKKVAFYPIWRERGTAFQKGDVAKLKRKVEKTGKYVVAIAYYSLFFILTVYILFFYLDLFQLNLDPRKLSLAGVISEITFSLVMIIIGKRLQNLEDSNVKKYLIILISLSSILALLNILTGEKPHVLNTVILAILISGFVNYKKLLSDKEFRNSLRVQEYKIKRQHWIIWIILFVILFIVSAFIDKPRFNAYLEMLRKADSHAP